MEAPFNFDVAPDRHNSGSYKWSNADADVIPLWVADMDFATAPCIVEALRRRVEHGVFGYVSVPESYYEALVEWFSHRHGWHIDGGAVIYTSGVVPAISAIIKALCPAGNGVIVQTPAYNCFFSSIRNNGCRIVENALERVDLPDGTFTYRFDYDDLERKAADPANTLMLLCNPHNPTGRVWTAAELGRVAEICHRHGVRIVSDEIHCELTMPGFSYVPFATVDPTAVICCSPSKAFNIAGLQIANIVTPDAAVRAAVDRAININEVCDVNPFGVVALEAAYRKGAPWLAVLKDYLAANYAFLCNFFARELPMLKVAHLEATYLAWIDVRALGIPSAELEEELLAKARVWVNAGSMYGTDGYIRINMACPRERLAVGLVRLKEGLQQL